MSRSRHGKWVTLGVPRNCSTGTFLVPTRRTCGASSGTTFADLSRRVFKYPPFAILERLSWISPIRRTARRWLPQDGMGGVTFWDIPSERPRRAFETAASQVRLSADGAWALIATREGIAKLLDSRTGSIVTLTAMAHSPAASAVAFSPDGRQAASGHVDGQINIWDVATGIKVASVQSGGHVTDLAFHRNGESLATCTLNGHIRVWRTTTMEKTHSFSAGSREGYRFALSRDGDVFAVRDANGIVSFGTLSSGEVKSTLGGGPKGWGGLAVSPDGALIAVFGGSIVELWDVRSETRKCELRGHSNMVHAVTFSPDSRVLASGSRDGTVRLWDLPGMLAEHLPVQVWQPFHSSRVAFSPDGELLASYGGGGARSNSSKSQRSGCSRSIVNSHDRKRFTEFGIDRTLPSRRTASSLLPVIAT